MSNFKRIGVSAGAAIAMVGSLLLTAPHANAQDADSITLNVASVGDQTFGAGSVYWCNDTDAANYNPMSSTNSCNFATKDDPLQLPYQQSISATVFTASNANETIDFSVTGNCAVGSQEFDPSSSPTTTAQVAAGGNVYVTALTGSGQCVMTGTTSGGGSLVPGTYTYTVNLQPADQQVTSPVQALQMPKRMRVGQRFRVKGVDPQVTNAGQQISWRVLPRSRDNCRLTELTSGAVVLRARSRGKCRVQATAPGVPGEWNRFVQRFSVPIR